MVAVVAVPVASALGLPAFLTGFAFGWIGSLHSGQVAARDPIVAWQCGHSFFRGPGSTAGCGASVPAGAFLYRCGLREFLFPLNDWNCCCSSGLLLSWHWCLILDWVWIIRTCGNSSADPHWQQVGGSSYCCRGVGHAASMWKRSGGQVGIGQGGKPWIARRVGGYLGRRDRRRSSQATPPCNGKSLVIPLRRAGFWHHFATGNIASVFPFSFEIVGRLAKKV